jgi:two-component system, LytTR family, response regulator
MLKVLKNLGLQGSLTEFLNGVGGAVIESLLQRRPLYPLAIFFLSIAAMQTGQDFLHAYLHGYQGYLSDSLVFKIYWLLFIPGLGLLLCNTDSIRKGMLRTHIWPKVIAGVVMLSAAHILLTTVLIVLVSYLFFFSPFAFTTPLYYFASEHIYLTLFFYGSGVAYIFLPERHKDSSAKEPVARVLPVQQQPEPQQQAGFISVSFQNKLIPIPVEEIVCMRSDRPYVRIHTCDGSYLHASTLKDMLDKLSISGFVRVHRSTVVNLSFVACLTSRANGDYDITMKNGEEVRMSRNYFPAFKKAMT